MTDTPKNEAPKRVSVYENSEVRGAALTCKFVHDNEQEKIKTLRERNAAYYASLPKNEKEAFRDILKNLCDPRDVGEPEYGARAALTIIHRLATNEILSEDTDLCQAIYWLTMEGLDALGVIEDGNVRSRDIADHFVHPERAFVA